MRIDKYGRIVLSRRNLLTLLHKLDVEGSNRTITKTFRAEMGHGCSLCHKFHEHDHLIFVSSESDEEHYKHTELPPGKMTPDTEEYIKERS